MKRSIKILSGLLAVAAIYTGCVKKVDPIDSFGVSVDFKSSGAKFITGDVEINPKDSIFLDFTVNSSREDIAVIEIQKNGTRVDTFHVHGARTFSAVQKYQGDSISGDFTYRIIARNNRNVFIGDGGKQIKVTVKPDYNFWSYRFLYVPDSTAKTNKCYYATKSGATFSYTEGAANSADIDFGYFYDTTTAGAPKHTIYALNASTFAPYDISSWTKNATVFKKVSSPSFANLTSGGAIRTAGIANLSSGTSSKITGLAQGNLLLFRTAQGKYGCIQVTFIEGASAEKSTYINVDVKVQK